MTHTALIAGASGLIGRSLCQQLQAEPAFSQLTALVRRPAGLAGGKLAELQVDYAQLARTPLPQVDTVFCCLGSTIKQAGSQAAFRQVDCDYVLALAQAARAAGARHFLVVSALGADANSPVFYNRVKGEMEAALQALDYPRLTIARPSLLLGERAEFRLGERVAAKLGWLAPARWRPIAAEQVARALLRLALTPGQGVQVVESAQLRALAAS